VKQFLKDKVVFYGQNLYAGTHTVSYNAVVATEGEFVFPPAQARDIQQPEVMGLSDGGVFTTKKIFDMPSVPPQCLPFDSFPNTQFFASAAVEDTANEIPPPSTKSSLITLISIVGTIVVVVIVVGIALAIWQRKALKKKAAMTVLKLGMQQAKQY